MATLHFKAILPKKFDARALIAEVAKEMQAVHKEIGIDFADTVATWEHKPKFDRRFEQSTRRIVAFTGATDEIYTYVSEGTRPHIIRPRRARALHFLGTYTAKTQPGVIKARSGGASGADVFSQGVQHPGSKGRKFDEAIAEKWRRPFAKRMMTAMGRGARKSGHAR